MSKIHIESSYDIPVEAAILYAIITDYEVGHPAILPKPFDSIQVDKGGQGAGTELTLIVKAMGSITKIRQRVTEPEPGRKVVESNMDNDLVTSFTFEPLNGGTHTRVTITTDYTPLNFTERFINPPLLRYMYKQELRNLEAYALENKQAIVTA